MTVNKKAYILIGIGSTLMVSGWLILVLLVLDVIKKTFAISLVSYSASLFGFLIAMGGLAFVVTVNRRRRTRDQR